MVGRIHYIAVNDALRPAIAAALLNERAIPTIIRELEPVTYWPSPATSQTSPGRSTCRHRKCGLHNGTIIIVPTRGTRIGLLIRQLPIPVSDVFRTPEG
ncbi:hypothetical protein AVEN_22454-1 [Araneus ventricosus]|uniref:Uncharacterized protein n=1 Tax=Araneus ventricosus TaxID=182803 RepID=A0A4Y2TJP0_ARAVE|nr:hypothetical protein AVEN_57281-1 [Araneus ventricosus]GBN99599.1 hypothetical protein AVEN_65710-1 [Araneus ventricosus]GBN99601.1 hypothetical protein AVEN_189598-1 [Araneus ventricosus]GBN99604.1 hypothetical protein AVEN_22454-1 [Araneus ventricosus]